MLIHTDYQGITRITMQYEKRSQAIQDGYVYAFTDSIYGDVFKKENTDNLSFAIITEEIENAKELHNEEKYKLALFNLIRYMEKPAGLDFGKSNEEINTKARYIMNHMICESDFDAISKDFYNIKDN